MPYQKYLKAVLFSFLVCWIIFSLAVLYQLGAPTESSRWIYELHNIKSSAAKSIKTPKLLIVSGSNALFGISSQMITQETGVPTVNTAIHAGLGSDYIFYRARSLAKNGDTVLLPLEYELYISGARSTDLLIDYVLARDPKYLITHPWFIALTSLQRVKTGISDKLHPPSKLEWGYQSKTINSSGDETNNRAADMTAEQHQIINKLRAIKISKQLSYDSPEFKIIRNFIDWCYRHNIKVFATWPNTIWFDTYKKPIYQDFFHKIEGFYKSIGVPVLGKYSDFMYDKSMFYDTHYHLNDRGTRQRTKQLIDLLK